MRRALPSRGPTARAISRTPLSWALKIAISSRSAKDRYRPDGWNFRSKGGMPPALWNHRWPTGCDDVLTKPYRPAELIAVIEHVKLKNVGIVYNWHHGHPHIDRFPELLRKMKPHLLALNINGMRKDGPKILPVGQGDLDEGMLRTVVASGYRGPIGILGHRAEVDAELALRENLDGLKKLRPKLQAPS